MKNYLERYRIELETIGPLYIGSGTTLRKKEWILDRNRAIIIDMRKLFDYLVQRNLLESFEKFFLNDKRSIGTWLYDNRIDRRDYPKFTSYALDCSGVNLKDNNVRDMALCTKNACGKPYIPGSSLKGALRNVILAKLVRKSGYDTDDIVRQIQNPPRSKKSFMQRQSRSLNTNFFNTGEYDKDRRESAVNDIMKGIRIADSAPLELSNLTLCQKIDINTKDRETELPIIRECIQPGTVISMEMTLDKKVLSDSPIDIGFIEEAIEEFLMDYNDMFLKKFPKETLYSGNVIYLGGGIGYASKTVTNQLFAHDKQRVEYVSRIIDTTLKEAKHHEDISLGVSPRVVKLTEYDGGLCQMGACRIDFIPF